MSLWHCGSAVMIRAALVVLLSVCAWGLKARPTLLTRRSLADENAAQVVKTLRSRFTERCARGWIQDQVGKHKLGFDSQRSQKASFLVFQKQKKVTCGATAVL